MTQAEIVERIRAEVKRHGGQRQAARHFGVSPQYLHDVLKGRREITDRLALPFGYRRVVTFERIGEYE